jgi:hypothetical protein
MRNVLLILFFGFLWLFSGCSRPHYAHFTPVASPTVVVRPAEGDVSDRAVAPESSEMALGWTTSASTSADPVLLPPAELATAPTVTSAETAPEFSRRDMRKLLRAQHQQMKAAGPNQQGDTRQVHGLAIASFISAIVGIFIAGIILGILAVVFGAIALGRIKAEPARFKGQGLAIAGIVLGAIVAILTIIVVAAAAP